MWQHLETKTCPVCTLATVTFTELELDLYVRNVLSSFLFESLHGQLVSVIKLILINRYLNRSQNLFACDQLSHARIIDRDLLESGHLRPPPDWCT